MKIRIRSSPVEFLNELQKFVRMAKPFANDRGFIRCLCNKCVNLARQQLDMIESHIFWYGFMGGYEVWIYHGENKNENITSNVSEQDEGIPDRDEMFDVFDDIICDDAEVDLSTVETSNVQ